MKSLKQINPAIPPCASGNMFAWRFLLRNPIVLTCDQENSILQSFNPSGISFNLIQINCHPTM